MNLTTIQYTMFLLFIYLITSAMSCKGPQIGAEGLTLIPNMEVQLDTLQKNIGHAKERLKFTPRTFTKGEVELVDIYDWCSGFYPGTLWNMYGLTKDPKWKDRAYFYTEKLDSIKYHTGTHDLGFIMECSYGTALNYIKSGKYENVIVSTASSLATRFNPKVGAIKSWDWSTKWNFPVIIDNMINLEILFHATRISRDSSYYKIAVSHADTTLKNHFRNDNSSYHVVDYDPTTGSVLQKNTHQGYSDESSWARGQAWGLYGYTMCYRETKDPKYLEQAIKIASFISEHPELPKDKIPYWDYDVDKKENTPKDASAGAITASALYELATFVDQSLKKKYTNLADQIIKNLSSPKYLASKGENGGFLLKHSTGHLPGNSEIDVPLNYADYYFLEALLRKGPE
ncbi:glycoside hydrolase family 88 protein [Confluentibacter flavum]|uniref:Glucuronyl hydrolase n=1 Tax=Confluentibacter flavum TaxID=1909700 RepID=A0A2N3HHI8_9FLAO|nr:glycoside hydrolase family 88 protein [Confluentibacter flavum]PKQ44435.1 glucuronyl hydrolase [Confluentibacter flavum]